MNIRSQVAAALDQAPLAQFETVYRPDPARSLRDTDQLSVNEQFVLLPFQVVTPKVRQFPELLREYYHALRLEPDSQFITRSVKHEREHADAARQVGCYAVLFGVMFAYFPDGHGQWQELPSLQPFTIPRGLITKIGYAAILAHPEDLSPQDELDLLACGFDNKQTVADHIAWHNRTHFRHKVPMPIGFDQQANAIPISTQNKQPQPVNRATALR